uniref:Uncharacterized protein n=1 Tax=Myoviridae sp. ctkOm7 TaxID=2826690 RepID=A0A8S5NNB9_9CAUD|nr:MAG TPA: hypothetical protein [Myoviridae sp. ctkOm7]
MINFNRGVIIWVICQYLLNGSKKHVYNAT